MHLSTVMEVASQLLFRQDVIGSDRLEYLLPHHQGVVHYAEFCAVPHNEDRQIDNLYDIYLLHGRRGNNFTGLWNASIAKKGVGFYALVQTCQTIERGFKDPDTGRIIVSDHQLIKGGPAKYNRDGMGIRITEGSQKHYTKCWDYDVFKVREERRLKGEEPDLWL